MALGHKFLVLYDYSAESKKLGPPATPLIHSTHPYPTLKGFIAIFWALTWLTKIWADALKSVFPETGLNIMESAAMPLSRHNKEEINFSAFSALLH